MFNRESFALSKISLIGFPPARVTNPCHKLRQRKRRLQDPCDSVPAEQSGHREVVQVSWLSCNDHTQSADLPPRNPEWNRAIIRLNRAKACATDRSRRNPRIAARPPAAHHERLDRRRHIGQTTRAP